MVLFNCNCWEAFTINSAASPLQAGAEVKSPSLKLSLTCAVAKEEMNKESRIIGRMSFIKYSGKYRKKRGG